MPNLPGFTAKIICNRGVLSEYNVEHPESDTTRATCWISSPVNETFQVQCNWYPDRYEDLDYLLRLRCDGITMCGPYVQHRRGQFAIRHANIKEEDGVTHRREMKFAHVELTDASDSEDTLPHIGVIELSVYRAKWTYTPAEDNYSGRSKAVQTGRKIVPLPERAKFLGAHRVIFGNDLGVGRSSYSTRLEKLYTARDPCYVFTFNYRSKGGHHFPEPETRGHSPSSIELLEAQEIIPRSPSQYHTPRSVPPSQIGDIAGAESSDDEDIDVLAARIHVLKQTIARLRSKKRKRSTPESPGSKEVIEISSD